MTPPDAPAPSEKPGEDDVETYASPNYDPARALRERGYVRVNDPRAPAPTESEVERVASKPRCCEHDCTKIAEFTIYGSNGHPENVTEACSDHVGHLCGTPVGQTEDDHWIVVPL